MKSSRHGALKGKGDEPPRPPVRTEEAGESAWGRRLSAALVDDGAPTPLYHQIYLVLRGLIQSGDFAAGSLLPGETGLAQQFEVSRITVKHALNQLAAENFVTRRRGVGTIVSGRPTIPVVRSSFDNLIESLHQMGLATEIELLDVQDVTAGDAGVAAQMKLPSDARLQRAIRRRKLEGEPLSYLVSYTPETIARHYTAKDLGRTPFLTLLERAGSAALEAEQWITAVAAEPQVAAALNVSTAAPVLRIERIMRDAEGQTVQLIFGYYRSDRFQYHVRNDSPQPRPPSQPAGKDP